MNLILRTLISLICMAPAIMQGTHIVGGEMTYTYLGSNRYRIRLDVYIDCINGQPGAISQDARAVMGVWDGNTRRMISGYPIEVNRSGPQRVQKTNYNCIAVAPNACVDRYWYETTLTLAPRTGGYIVSFQRCCRNNTITNLTDPGGTGANYWTTIPDPRTTPNARENNSAVFKELPPNFLCTNTALKFDHSATDPDGDSLAYDLFRPFTGGERNAPRPDNTFGNGFLENPPFSQVIWAPGYNELNPVDGTPPLNIDPITGHLTLTPTLTGQFVVGIRVREFRRGVLISETKRDYQFNVQSCVIDVVASYFAPSIICGFSYQFRNQSTGATRYLWDFGVAGRSNDTSNQFQPTFTFPAAGKYKVRLFAWKRNCVDSFVQEIEVLEPKKPKLPADTAICENRSLNLTCNVTGESYRWSTGQTTRDITVSTPGLFWVEVTVKTCKWRDSMVLQVDRTKIAATGDTLYCSDEQFSRRLRSTSGLAKYLWSNGETTADISVAAPGRYIVTGTTVNGCVSTDTVTISRYSPVVVKLPDTTVCPGVRVRFDNQNPNADRTTWSNGDTGRFASILGPGTFVVKVTKGLCSTWDTFEVANHPKTLELGPDLRFCESIDTLITAPRSDFRAVTWNTDVAGQTFRLMAPGKLQIDVLNRFGCPERDSIRVNLFPNPRIDLGRDTLLCLSVHPVLDPGPGMISYKWQDGTRDRVYIARDPGEFWVEVKDPQGCLGRDTIIIDKRGDLYPSILFMPNAFTPDGNGINDLYPMNKFPNLGTLYVVKLYNRWGEKIAELNTPEMNWDGRINGVDVPEGAYVYLATWIGCDNVRRTIRGSFHVLR